MPRYIDADALMEKVGFLEGRVVGVYKRDIEQAPTAAVAPVRRGKWRMNEDGEWSCSTCDGLAVEHPEQPDKWQALTAFCPNCGAHMERSGDA